MQYSGFLIRKLRLEKDWSQEGLCKGICAVSYLSKIEQGKTEASGDILSALFAKLGAEWSCDTEFLEKGKNFIEDWYEAAFSADFDEFSVFLEKYRTDYFALRNSPFSLDVMLLENFAGEESVPLDEKLEACMNKRQLALQRLLGGKFEEAITIFPCAFMFYRTGVFAYEKGDNTFALENLQKAYDLAAQEGRICVMMFSKLFITNCYSNMQDILSMERHGKIAKKLAQKLGRTDLAKVVDYNLAATKIENGEYEKAYEYFSSIEEPSAFSLHKLAVCCEKLGKYEEALSAIEKEKLCPPEDQKEIADRACELIRIRIENSDYLSLEEYGQKLLELFNICHRDLPVGYAKFHLPRVVEWYTANRQYKQAFELLNNFPEK